mmetsp:Transcript_23019/g.35595  ORF Transcript_23019/g.35595 Transcript_23019/m.35595 type:complete len:147 (+) Transcript_23019:623-1063(+)
MVRNGSVISSEMIYSSMQAYREKANEYTLGVSEALENYGTFQILFGWMIFQFGPDYPSYIGEYDGYTFANTYTIGGWGDPTIGIYDVTKKGIFVYGRYGTTDEWEDKALDLNPDECIDRYVAVTMYPLGFTYSYPQENGVITFSNK